MKSSHSFHHQGRSGPSASWRTVAAAAVLSCSLLFPAAASAAPSLTADSSTYLQSREASDSSKILGAYEYLDVAVQSIGNETISFHSGGWLRYDLKQEEYGKKSNSDLQYSYLSFKSKTDNLVVNLGRVMVFEGVAAERVDGMYARTDLKARFGVSAFGGSPVETGTDLPGSSLIYGGRLSHQSDSYQFGVSALKEEKDGNDFRKESGVDLWVRPLDKVSLSGKSSWNDITKGWMEHTYALLLGNFGKFRFNTTASWISYDDYFYATTLSAFKLSTDLVTPGEKVRILGEEATFLATDKITIAADYRNFDYDIAGKADYYGGKIRFSAADAGGAGLSYHRMEGDTDKLKYSEYRVYGYKKFGHVDVTADIIDIAYVNAINGVKDSYSASLAALYDLSQAWKLGADVEYSHNPDFDKDVRTFLKVLYHFGAKGGA